MTVPTGTYKTYEARGIREDLADIIYDISPMETPFVSTVSRGSCSNTYCEWQTDALAAASATNQHLQGDDSAVNTATATTRYGNYTQISKKTVQVSGTQRAVNTAGRADEYEYQLMKRGKELKRDIETRLTSRYAGYAGSAATASEAAGAVTWLFGNEVKCNASSTITSITTVPTTDAVPTNETAITEAMLKSAIQLAWTDGGDPTWILCDAVNKQKISAFSGIATQYHEVSKMPAPGSIIGSADVYVSDFGKHTIQPSRFIDTAAVLVLDPEYWEVKYLRPIQEEKLAKTGDSDKGHILAEYTLCAKNPNSSAIIWGTS